ncbi:transglutaminase domain-containing protein [Candidatus Poribacteria bacterium]|nr:transglutaminase domain-containing protein [Candidatus Poribacteria bacterium]
MSNRLAGSVIEALGKHLQNNSVNAGDKPLITPNTFLNLGLVALGAWLITSGKENQQSESALSSPMKVIKKNAPTMSDSVRIIRKMIDKFKIDSQIITLTRRIIPEVKNFDWRNELATLYNWVQGNIRYVRDPLGIDAFQTPLRTLELQSGDCDDMTSLIGAMAESIGYPIALVVSQTDPDGTFNHIFPVAVLPNGDTAVLDATNSVGFNQTIPYYDHKWYFDA